MDLQLSGAFPEINTEKHNVCTAKFQTKSHTGFHFGMWDSDVWQLLMLAMMLPLMLSPLSSFYKNFMIYTCQDPKYNMPLGC